ncbi:MAG: endonuclease, partial [Flavobacteriales bacterium]
LTSLFDQSTNNTDSMHSIHKMMIAASLLIISTTTALAQAILPTSWNFDVAPPAGWSESLGASNTRYANGQTGQACRLDQTGDFVLVEFAEEPGSLTYWIKGQNSGGSWQGTFTVEQSAVSASGPWTALRTFNGAELPAASFTQFTDAPASATRYIRFFFTNKVSGHNVALDEVALGIPTASNAQEINVAQDGSNIPSGFTYSIGNSTSTVFTIENLGLADVLTINDITLSGPDAGQFSLTPSGNNLIPAGASEQFELNFTPVGDGSRFCTITIDNDDSSEAQYLINIYAVAGSFATEPTAQAASISFPNLVSWDYNVNFTAGNPVAEQYLVLRRKGAAVASAPADGMTYVKGAWIGDAQVVYIGNAGSFNAREVEVSTSYHFAVYAFNGPSGFENYLTDSPLTGVASTPAPAIGNYYQGVDHTEETFVADLITALNPSNYFQIFYSNYISTLINRFYVQDTAVAGVSMNMVKCQYSGVPYLYEAGFQFWNGQGDGTISREHTFPQSWMPTYFEPGFDDMPEVSDLHNLLPTLQVECNAVRSNYPYGEVVAPTSTFEGTAIGDNSIGQRVYEPREGIKGDAARSMMYQATKYFSTTADFSLPEQISLIIPYGQNERLLKEWHFADLPDNMERARNEYVFEEQNNRNAYIDSVQYPCFIRFSNMTKWEPQVIISGAELTVLDEAVSYQWFLDGEEIDGATEATYTATETGNYSVSVQQLEECPSISTDQLLIDLAVAENDVRLFELEIYPNPAEDQFRVQVLSLQGGLCEVRMFDAAGREVYTSGHGVARGETMISLSPQLESGIYTLSVRMGDSIRTKQVVIR